LETEVKSSPVVRNIWGG